MENRLTRTRYWTKLAWTLWTVTVAALLGACGGGGSGAAVAPPPPPPPPPPPVTFAAVDVYVSHNGANNAGTVSRLDENGNLLATFDAGNNLGIAIDASDNLYLAGELNAPPANLRVINRFDGRSNAAAFDAQVDREFAAPGAMMLPGITIGHRAGLLIAANFQGSSIEVYGTAAGDGAAPIASVVIANEPHDVAYDEASDRLFVAATNGTIEVIDNFVSSGFSTASSRTISPVGAVDLRGIAYDAPGDRLVVTDVGTLGVADDGKVMVIVGASTASGAEQPFKTFTGAATMLGDPMDVVLNGETARIAEYENDLVLTYKNIMTRQDGDIAADLAVDAEKPQALAVGPATGGAGAMADITDLDDAAAFSTDAIGVALNPAGGGGADVLRLTPALDAMVASLDSTVALENIVFSQAGDALATFDDGSDQNGGIYILNRAAVARDGDIAAAARDRIIQGAATGIVSPKGIDLDDASGLVIIADNDANAPSVSVFGAEAAGDVAPLFSTPLPGRPWDIDYDPVGDRLYVALNDGTVAVLDEFLNAAGLAGSRIITPRYPTSTGTELAQNLHGIVHVAASDMLIVSDVGNVNLDTDGKIFVIENASTASGVTDIAVQINNGNDALLGATQLGNPVDIAYDGASLYVTEKTGDRVLRFDDILASAGGDVAPAASMVQDSPESVAILPDYLARDPSL